MEVAVQGAPSPTVRTVSVDVTRHSTNDFLDFPSKSTSDRERGASTKYTLSTLSTPQPLRLPVPSGLTLTLVPVSQQPRPVTCALASCRLTFDLWPEKEDGEAGGGGGGGGLQKEKEGGRGA